MTNYALSIIHNRCARIITGRFITKEEDGTWIFQETTKTLQLAHVDEYILKGRDTITNYAMGTEIYSKWSGGQIKISFVQR